LIDGELISKMGKNRPHVNVLNRAPYWLIDAFGRDRVNPSAPIDVASEDNPTNEPEPDANRSHGEGQALRPSRNCRVLGPGFDRPPLDCPPRTPTGRLPLRHRLLRVRTGGAACIAAVRTAGCRCLQVLSGRRCHCGGLAPAFPFSSFTNARKLEPFRLYA